MSWSSSRPIWRLVIATSIGMLLGCEPAQPSTNPPAETAREPGVIETRAGSLRGTVDSRGILGFKGIPYGASTAGENRFRPPQPAAGWSGIRDADAWGPICPQTGVVASGSEPDYIFGHIEQLPMNEDCLVLNVWTPAADDRKRPVMVWLHGRGFSAGAGSEPPYHGAALADRGDVVVVSINHRLNVFGYLHLEELFGESYRGSGMAGMLDAKLALEWVRDNIGAFGGDPDRVTVFGESGGGFKVGTLLAMPEAQGLFHRAIVQSGPALRLAQADAATATARALLARLGIDSDDPAALHTVPMEELLAALESSDNWRLIPVVAPPHLPRHPFEPDAAPSARGVPLMIGSNRDEMTLFTLGDPQRGTLDEAALEERLRDALAEHARQVISGYAASRPDASPWELYIAIISDGRFRQPSLIQADRMLADSDAPVYVYEFWYESDYAGLGAAHAVEIPFVFAQGDRIPMTGSGPGRYAMTGAMSDAWVAFARHGDPNHAGLPPWPPYDTESRPTMVFDVPSRVIEDPRAAEREAWDGAPLMR